MEELNRVFDELSKWLLIGTGYGWVLQVFVIVFITLLLNYFARKLFDRLSKGAEKTSSNFDDLLIYSARKPVRIFIWIAGLLTAADIVREVSSAPIFDFIGPIREVSFIALFSWFAVRVIRQLERVVQRPGFLENPMDATTASAIGKLLRLSVVITTGLVILQTLGFSVSGILAFGGIGGIAVGFAAKDLLANFFGGLIIYLDRPFKVGDWVRSPDKEIEGIVEHIGWRVTCIRTFDKRPLYVPNATFATVSLENPSRMTNRRIYETIGLRYEDADKLEPIVAAVKEMLQTHEDIDTNQTLMVNVNSFASSSIDFFLYTFTKTTNWQRFHEVKQDVMFKIIAIVESHGAEFAFPTRTLHMINDADNSEVL